MITPKTAGNHIEHIYSKIGASSRVGASLFAMQHGLLPETQIAASADRVRPRKSIDELDRGGLMTWPWPGRIASSPWPSIR